MIFVSTILLVLSTKVGQYYRIIAVKGGGIGLASQSKTVIEGLEGFPCYPVSL